ncbi:FadR/GntR family transcriptional regulator [Bacillus pinisoli]|uniref:FadR/GntR family transcriptional regulator n=1 Tax=Bacillus pinisoli TaxID=2901866 RepID=UPI001FF20402|nr:FadR/GntR family transcriptional regulator [Bacillus pinisoli]
MVIYLSLKPIKKKRLFEEIILAIEQYIKNENIQPGGKLPSENELSSIFQVSKTAVREAMSVLQANGLIEKRSGAGIFLKEIEGINTVSKSLVKNLFQNSEILEVLEFRRGIEVEAVSLAAIRATPEDIERISQAHEELIAANKAGGLGLEEDYNFHYAIILASHNSIYKEVFNKIASKFEEGMRISKLQSAKVPGRFAQAYKEHEDILKAICLKDPKLASEAMRHHLLENERKIWNGLQDS